MNLDKNQLDAINFKDCNGLVVAAPGAGKTTVILKRVQYLIEEKGISENNIIILTFTKNAAVSMKKRYKEETKKVKTPFFGTFHGLFYKILSRKEEVKMISTNDTYNIVKKGLYTYLKDVGEDKIKEMINAIGTYKSKRYSKDSFQTSVDKEIFLKIYNDYENFKESAGLYDFEDLQIRALDLLYNNEMLLESYRKLFKYILVDEFQDCDENQIEFLQLMNKGNYIYAVGDEDQCIYSFRGAYPEPMVRFSDFFDDGEKIYLEKNYRCAKSIVDLSRNIIKYNKSRNDKKIESYREDKGVVKYIIADKEDIEGKDITSKIKLLKNENKEVSFSDFAVIYRTNEESRIIVDNLIRNDIPFRYLDRAYNFFDHFICKDILAYLSLSIKTNDVESFFRIINKPFRYVSRSSLEKIKDLEIGDVFENYLDRNDLPPYQEKKLVDLKIDIQYLNTKSLSYAIATILNDLGYLDYLKEYSIKYKVNIDDLLEIVREFQEIASEHKTVINLLSYVKEYTDTLENSKVEDKDAVILSTIHGVKGMEFKNVFLINVNEDNLPHCNNEDIEEERRLYYVAVTRAIDNLYIYSCKFVRGTFMDASRFIKESGLILT